MKKIVLFGVFNASAKEKIRKRVPDNFNIVELEQNNNLDELYDARYIITRTFPIDKRVLDAAPKLKMIQRWGVGYDKVDVETAGKRGIPVTICFGINSIPVAEMTVLHMLAIYRNLIPLNAKIKENIWLCDKYLNKAYMLKGKIVGLLGIGSIGQQVGLILKNGFGCKVQYYDVNPLTNEEESEFGFKYVEFDELLKSSDIISLHVPLSDNTHNIINRDSFIKMKTTAIIINTSRGGIIDEDALLEALKSKVIAGAGIDTFVTESPDIPSPLLELENVVATPHCGGNTVDNESRMVDCCIQNILKFDSGNTPMPPILVNQNFLCDYNWKL